MSSNAATEEPSGGGPMTGKTALITGATSGIGKATALGLASMGADLVITGREVGRTESAAGEIQTAGGGQVDVFVGDLSAQSEVRRLAAEVLQRFSRLDVLVNNVGGYWNTSHVTADGLERTFALNHLASFLLTNLLLDRLKHSAPARVVTVANALHPGAVSTSFGAEDPATIQRIFVPFVRPFMKSPARGAVASIQVASASDLEDVTGSYFSGRRPKKSSKESYNAADAARLWQVSAGLVGLS